ARILAPDPARPDRAHGSVRGPRRPRERGGGVPARAPDGEADDESRAGEAGSWVEAWELTMLPAGLLPWRVGDRKASGVRPARIRRARLHVDAAAGGDRVTHDAWRRLGPSARRGLRWE